MRSRKMRSHGLTPSHLVHLLLGLSVLACAAGVADAQVQAYANPVDLQELQGLAALGVADQLRFPNQRRLQEWFLYNVGYYRQTAWESCAGRSPVLVDVGPVAYPNPTGAIAEVIAPPSGRGPVAIYWAEQRNILGATVFGRTLRAPSTFPEGIYFPRDQGVQLNVQNVNTCWHEMQHAVLERHDPLDIPDAMVQAVDDGGDDQERREHVYILFAERTIEWLRRLAAFETHARAAYAEQLTHERRGCRSAGRWSTTSGALRMTSGP